MKRCHDENEASHFITHNATNSVMIILNRLPPQSQNIREALLTQQPHPILVHMFIHSRVLLSQKVCPLGRPYTVSVALPGSIINNAQSAELRTCLAGQVARAMVIFNVDEVVVFDESAQSGYAGLVVG